MKGTQKQSRIGVIWDQIQTGFEKSDENVPFGRVYTNDMINNALNSTEEQDKIPTGDMDGHGTFLTAIAAGGENREEDYTGIARESEIAVVRLKQSKSYLREYFGIKEDVPAYEETDIIYGVYFLLLYARKMNKPISILIGVGTSNGGHSGQTFLERFLDAALENVGVMVSVPAGNEGNARLHYSGELSVGAAYETVELHVGENQDALVMELWGDRPTTFGIGLEAPGGERLELISPRFGKEELVSFTVSKVSVYVAYQLLETYTGDELIFIRLIRPTPGIWKLIVYGDEGRQRTYNIWLPLRQFLSEDTYFLRPDPGNTITNPGNANFVMTMTAYNHQNGSLFAQAGRGVEDFGVMKPDLAAPGVSIMGPGPRGSFIRRTGTSIAAAHSAGMLAQFFQWNQEKPEIGDFFAAQTQSLFLKNAERNENVSYPNPLWGYGIMNIENVIDDFRVTG